MKRSVFLPLSGQMDCYLQILFKFILQHGIWQLAGVLVLTISPASFISLNSLSSFQTRGLVSGK